MYLSPTSLLASDGVASRLYTPFIPDVALGALMWKPFRQLDLPAAVS